MIDLTPSFPNLHWRLMRHSLGVEVASDFIDYPADHAELGLYKECGLWTMEEANILYSVGEQIQSYWLDIGGHTGWTAAHLAWSGNQVHALDPMYQNPDFKARALQNMKRIQEKNREAGFVILDGRTSNEFFEKGTPFRVHPANRAEAPYIEHRRLHFNGVVIDGDHASPCPLEDAKNAMGSLTDGEGVILLHDAVGQPVQEAVLYLASQGFRVKLYLTPHVVACCWRGVHLQPPSYAYSPKIAHILEHNVAPIIQFA